MLSEVWGNESYYSFKNEREVTMMEQTNSSKCITNWGGWIAVFLILIAEFISIMTLFLLLVNLPPSGYYSGFEAMRVLAVMLICGVFNIVIMFASLFLVLNYRFSSLYMLSPFLYLIPLGAITYWVMYYGHRSLRPDLMVTLLVYGFCSAIGFGYGWQRLTGKRRTDL